MGSITVALAGNPNTGKTSLFNNITGARQHVGNWPGVTVEKREGEIIYRGELIKVVDLPGIYSMGAYSEDEVVAREYILNEKPDVIVNVVDSTNLNRNLYLTVQLLEMDADVIIALNMMDETKKLGIDINLEKLSQYFGTNIVPTIATKRLGIDEINEIILTKHKLEEKGTQKKKGQFKVDYGPVVEEKILQISKMIDGISELSKKYPSRWLSIKLLEDDEKLNTQISAMKNGKDLLDYIRIERKNLENQLGTGLDSYIISKRYELINKIVKQCVSTPKIETNTLTDKIDSVLTHRIWGLPFFIAVMYLVFVFTFKFSEPLVGLMEMGVEGLSELAGNGLAVIGASEIFTSFIIDGIIGGVGSVLSIVPVLFMLFMAIAVLEDSGYMARVAYIMDKPMRTVGLNGKAFIPFILGFGCNVPAVMATRTLESKRDRLITIMANPFISCSARLPVYVLFAGAFFSKNQALVVASLYLIGIVMAIATTKLFGKLIPESEDSSFIIELPPYRIPTLRGVLIHMWDKVSDFVKRVTTIILAAVVIIWLLSSLPAGVEYASDESLIGKISSFIAPIFKPAGFGTWQATIALIFGVLAKEVVVSTFGVVYKAGEYGLDSILMQHFTPLSAYSFMLMALLYSPCIATIGCIKSETKSVKWTVIAILYGLVCAWILSVLTYQIGLMLGFE
ncbi:MAG TPA: ferrous iron transport protein B [Clostridiaceae bacterium]|nr:ferrous iron transport protein B [Clostridiaceae bacterium]